MMDLTTFATFSSLESKQIINMTHDTAVFTSFIFIFHVHAADSIVGGVGAFLNSKELKFI